MKKHKIKHLEILIKADSSKLEPCCMSGWLYFIYFCCRSCSECLDFSCFAACRGDSICFGFGSWMQLNKNIFTIRDGFWVDKKYFVPFALNQIPFTTYKRLIISLSTTYDRKTNYKFIFIISADKYFEQSNYIFEVEILISEIIDKGKKLGVKTQRNFCNF